MEIIVDNQTQKSLFGNLEIGYNFLHKGSLYVKSSGGTAIDLKEQELENFESETEVEEVEITKIECQLII